MKIDTHQHFWIYEPPQYSWIDDSWTALKRDNLPGDLVPHLSRHGVDGTVAVQARHDERENSFLLDLAEAHPFIMGVIGWVDLRTENVAETLDRWSSNPRFRGVRYVLHDAPELMDHPDFLRGLEAVAARNLVFELHVLPDQLEDSAVMFRRVPNLRVAVDHAGKPPMASEDPQAIDRWRRGIAALAEQPNIFCKISGLVSEVPGGAWTDTDYRPILDTVFEAFEPGRTMYGSDWPTCGAVGAGYDDVARITGDYVAKLSPGDREMVMGGAAAHCYGI